MKSIRLFLIMVSLAVITLVNFVAALQGYRTGLAHAQTLFDEQLIQKAELLVDLSNSTSPRNSTQILGSQSPYYLFQVFDSKNRTFIHSENAEEKALANFTGKEQVNYFSNINHNGFLWRAFITKKNVHGIHALVAERTDIRYQLADSIALDATLPIVLGLPLVFLLIWIVVTLGLMPLSDLTKDVAIKKSQDLSPIRRKTLPRELQPLLNAVNGLLSRLSESLEYEKRFSGDAAHELRTPISALKINLYNLKKEVSEGDQTLAEMEQSLSRMSHLIEQMLSLYRMSPEQFQAGLEKLDIRQLCQQVLATHFHCFAKKNQDISLEGQSTEIEANAFALEILIKNLADNASKYTPDNGTIEVSVGTEGDLVTLTIEDSGRGIPEQQRRRVLERFYRISSDTTEQNPLGCGLGLSIVKHIVDLHKGTISMTKSRHPTGLKIEIRLPKQVEHSI